MAQQQGPMAGIQQAVPAPAPPAQAAVPPPPPPPAPMATEKEIKMNPPTPFTGIRRKLDEFLMEVDMYLAMNRTIYDTNEKKILFALSYMKDGTAGPWKHSYWRDNVGTPTAQSWDDFKTTLRASFDAPDKQGDAVTKMETETMSGKTADEYVEEFKIWAAESGVTQDRPLIEWFMKGIPTPLLDKILNLENPPSTIQGWYDTASKMDNQWRKAKAIAKRLRGEPKKGIRVGNNSQRYVPPPAYKDPNAMDWTTKIDRLNDAQRDEHMKKGLCFICHQSGHRANDHNQGSSYPGPRRQYTPQPPPSSSKAEDAYARIKAIYESLPKDEREKLASNIEDSGF